MSAPIQIGKLGKPHGLKGEIHVIPANDDYLDFLDEGVYVLIRGLPYLIRNVREAGGVVISLEGLPDRTAVEGLRGLPVAMAYSEELAKIEDENPFEEWIGFFVEDQHTQIKYGPIVDIIELPTQLTAVIEQDKKEILIPLHQDLILSMDMEKRIIFMNLPEGLVDLYL
jgi:16S rRNA processing protein RimM